MLARLAPQAVGSNEHVKKCRTLISQAAFGEVGDGASDLRHF